MKLKSHLMILFPVLVPLALFWGCGKGGSPVGPASASSVKITIPMTSVQGKLLGASLNTFLYYFSGSGAPVTGSVGPITSASLGGSFSFTVNLPSSSYNFVALQLNNSATQQALAIGAAAISSS
ncbi:MAG TPA: hypothetical protein VN963_05665, partial [bacterium]|nr:hypothetical protein [bacterium]